MTNYPCQMSVSELTTSTQNYLKAIWGLTEWSSNSVTATEISQKTGLKLSSVSDGMRRLGEAGLVHYSPYAAIELTELGRKHALAMVRRHRMIETFLVEVLGYRWDQVHDEAENLEHAVSDFMIDQLDKQLGFPTRDPHGDPIPRADGTIVIPNAVQLNLVPIESKAQVRRISDADPGLLKFFDEHKIGLDTKLEVLEPEQYSNDLSIKIPGSDKPLALGKAAAQALYVEII
jgi:DtxR family Mn-dependent transcriptional regulator